MVTGLSDWYEREWVNRGGFRILWPEWRRRGCGAYPPSPSSPLPQIEGLGSAVSSSAGSGRNPGRNQISAFLPLKYSIWSEQIQRFLVTFGKSLVRWTDRKWYICPIFQLETLGGCTMHGIWEDNSCLGHSPMRTHVHASVEDITSL